MSSTTAAVGASLHNTPSIHQAFIHDDFALQCSRAQHCTFLRTGIVPAAGQRVELTIVLNSALRGDLPFRLSGEVTVVRPMPSWGSGSSTNENHWRPSCSFDDCGPSRGSSLLSYILRKKLPQERAGRDGSMPNLIGIWERVVTSSAKEEFVKRVVNKFRVVHKQQVVCEGR